MTTAITKSEISDGIAQKMQRSETQIVAASFPSEENPRVRDMSGSQISALINKITVKAAVRLGSKPKDQEDLIVLKREINADLMKFPTMTAAELLQALENGLDGLYSKEPPMHFTPSYFAQWVRSYVEQTKKPVIAKYMQIKGKHDKEQDDPEISERQRLVSFHELFLYAVENASYQDHWNMVYDFLDQIKFLGITKGQKWEAVNQAKANLKLESVNYRIDSFAKTVKRIIEGSDDEAKAELIISEAKRLIVRGWLADMRSKDEEEQRDILDMVQERVDYKLSELAE